MNDLAQPLAPSVAITDGRDPLWYKDAVIYQLHVKSFFDANNDGTVNSSDQIANGNTRLPVGSFDPGVGMPTLPTVIDKLMVVGGSKGTLNDTAIDPDMGAPRRVSWREIVRD